MTIRCAVLGLAVAFACSVWAWCRPCGPDAQAQPADPVYAAGEAGTGAGGNRDEAVYRYRMSQSNHWRQVALGR